MWKAVVWKELRENWWVAGLGLAAYLWMVASWVGLELLPVVRAVRVWAMPFVETGFLVNFTVLSLALTVALGLRQTLSESVRGTWLFLLHRPMPRGTLVGLKLALGSVLYLACAATPILLYAWWAATPGTHASPFFWSMTVDTWIRWFSLWAMYLAAFLVGLRPGRWIGSRLFPMAGAGLILLLQRIPQPRLLELATVVVLMAVLLTSIFYVARVRDFS
jgi:hypothetical protein